MKAEIRSFFWVDVVPEQIQANVVDESFVIASLEIGPRGGQGAEIFYASFFTPQWLIETLGHEQVVSGRHHYFVKEIDLVKQRSFLEMTVLSLDGEDWPALAQQLARVMAWEFEDYRP